MTYAGQIGNDGRRHALVDLAGVVAPPRPGVTDAGSAPVTVSDTAVTADGSHYGHVTILDGASLVTVTIPTDDDDDLPVGFWSTYFAAGAGGVTLSTTDLTLAGSSPSTGVSQNQSLFVQKTGPDTWLVLGGTA